MRTRSFSKQHQPPKLMLPVVKLGCFWCRYFSWKMTAMLTALFYSIWGHRHKDNLEEISAREKNLWLQLHGPPLLCVCKDRGACSTHWTCSGWAHALGAVAWVVQGKHTENTLCLLRAATVHLHWHAPQPAHASVPGWSWKKDGYETASLSRRAAVRDLPAELRVWGERGLRCWRLASQPPLPALSQLLTRFPSLPSRL